MLIQFQRNFFVACSGRRNVQNSDGSVVIKRNRPMNIYFDELVDCRQSDDDQGKGIDRRRSQHYCRETMYIFTEQISSFFWSILAREETPTFHHPPPPPPLFARVVLYPFVIPLSPLKERFPFLLLHLIYLFFSSFIRSLLFYTRSPSFFLSLPFFLRHHRLNKVHSVYFYLCLRLHYSFGKKITFRIRS